MDIRRNRMRVIVISAVLAGCGIMLLSIVLSPEVLLVQRLSLVNVGVTRGPNNEATVYFRCTDDNVRLAQQLLDRYSASANVSITRVWVLDPVSDRGLERIVERPGIAQLTIQSSAITNVAIPSVGGAADLRVLSINCANVNCDGINGLASLVLLEQLDLTGSKMTDDCLQVIAALPRLRFLGVSNTRVTESGVLAFRMRRADVQVVHSTR